MLDFLEIVGLSISVSLAATAIATAISLPVGTALAIFTFRGRQLIVVLINGFFGLPPVVVGLVLYLALSRSGPLGSLAPWSVTSRPLVGEAPTIDLVVGYSKANTSPVLKLFLSRIDDLRRMSGPGSATAPR
jgi:ABC-type tungstate transport system substrate-binding protein